MTEIKLLGIAFRQKKGMPMQVQKSTTISKEYGVEGDSRGNLSIHKSNRRQVTVLSNESWNDALTELVESTKESDQNMDFDLFEKTLHWSARRANLLITGIKFNQNDVGKQLQIGNVILEITRETDPCHMMDSIQQGLKNALYPEWRGGVCTKVICGGQINVGDIVRLQKQK